MLNEHPLLLAADDDPGILALVDCFAREQGFEVIGRGDGCPVLTGFPSLNADVALLDLRMPQVGGLDVLRAIHDTDSTCPVILMTAYPTVDSAIEAVKLGALDYLSKPLDFDRLGDPYLTAAFLNEFSRRFGRPVTDVSAGAERLLQRAPWCGNIRELRNVLERACMLSDGRVLSEREMLVALGSRRAAPIALASGASEPCVSEPLPGLDHQRINQVLQQVGGNRSAAARVLGISRRALYRRLSAFDVH